MLEPAGAGFRPDPKLHIAMPFQGRWVRKVFVRGLGVPRGRVYSVLRGVKSVWMSRLVRMRRRSAAAMTAKQPDLAAWQRSGSRALREDELRDLEPALECCRRIQRDAANAPSRDPARGKEFLRFVASNQDFLAHGEVVRFALSEPILHAVSAYLGTVPVLASVALLSSPPQPEGVAPSASQRFHNDHEDTSQVKIFVHVEDVTSEHGVFTFHSAETTQRIRHALGTRRGRLDDDEVACAAAGESPVTLIGPAGSAWFVDTSRCLHYGSRSSEKHRLVLQAQYLRCDSPAFSNLAFTLNEKQAAEARSPLERMVLGLR
jgi:hypothetical protein